MTRLPLRRNPLQEEQRIRTRALVTQGALAVFAEHGFLGSSIEQILVRAGVSRSAFYSQFDGKLAVVCAIVEDFEPEWTPLFDVLADLHDPDMESLTAWAAIFLDFHRNNLETCTLLTQVTALEEKLYWQVLGQRDALIRRLGENHPAFAAAKHDCNALLEARLVLGHIDQACFHIVRQNLPDPGGHGANIIARNLLGFLQGGR